MTIDWRSIGPVSVEVFRIETARVNSPLFPYYRQCWAAAGEHSALALAMAWHEGKYATRSIIPRKNRNPLALRGEDRDYATFPTWPDGFAAWRSRLTDKNYRGGVYARTTDLASLISVFAPASDKNDELRYLEVVIERLNAYRQMEADMAGSKIEVIQNILPVGASNRPTTKIDTSYGYVGITAHQTGNYREYAGAVNQIGYLHTQEARMRDVAYHLSTDDLCIAQGLPLDIIGWHAADGCDNWAQDVGCFRTISIEGCVNAGANYKQSILNYAECIARLHLGDESFDWGDGHTKGLVSLDHIYQHIQVAQNYPPHHCPHEIIVGQMGYTWPKFLDEIDRAIDRIGTGTPKPTYGPDIFFPKYKVGHAVVGAVSRKQPSAASDRVRPYEAGTALRLVATREGQQVDASNAWYRISSPGGPSNGAYIHASGVAEVGDPAFEQTATITAHAVPGAVSRISASRSAEIVRQYQKPTALRIVGWEHGEDVAGSERWFVIRSKGPSDEARIHASGLAESGEWTI